MKTKIDIPCEIKTKKKERLGFSILVRKKERKEEIKKKVGRKSTNKAMR